MLSVARHGAATAGWLGRNRAKREGAAANECYYLTIASVHGNSPNLAERARLAMTERSDDNAQTSPNVAQGSMWVTRRNPHKIMADLRARCERSEHCARKDATALRWASGCDLVEPVRVT